MEKKIIQLLDEIHQVLDKKNDEIISLPQETYVLPCGDILCTPREFGDSRFPYDSDGLTIWAHTTGYINACEGKFNVFREAHYNEDSAVVFFAGVKDQNDNWLPLSINGSDRMLFEPEDVKRYIVFSLRCAYYICETNDFIFSLRVHIDQEKNMFFSSFAYNKGEKKEDIYMSSYFEAMMRYIASEDFFNKMTKYSERLENGSCLLYSQNRVYDYLSVRRKINGIQPEKIMETVGKRGVLGFRGRNLANAEAWKNGDFSEYKTKVNTTDTPVATDIIYFTLNPKSSVRIDYELSVTHNRDDALAECSEIKSSDIIDKELSQMDIKENEVLNNLRVEFFDWKSNKVNPKALNKFVQCVKKQVNFCAMGDNYAGALLGIRDVFQQLESALIWDPVSARKQIVRVFDSILSSGRAPRQISFPEDEGVIPEFDLRPYIDQGMWIIMTVYTYLCWTGDYSILNEECGYYDCEKTYGPMLRSNQRDSVLCHLIRIFDYLSSNIDDRTSCMHALYGDWNDALDGLGRTRKEGKEFGDGVTVMATLQFWANISEMIDILTHVGGYDEYISKLKEMRERVKSGLIDNAVDKKDNKNRIIHGWGDEMSYKVGSFNDYDGKERISLTANSFWNISGMIRETPELKNDILTSLEALDSKYGLLTFDKYFPMGSWQVGRISTITPGTYENSCAYVHASTFGIMALFLMGESEKAWEQLEKSIVITHDNATLTTFVMPNSYCNAPEYEIDGDSMGDWYTGSGTVVIKALVRFGFGVYPCLDKLRIQTPKYMPCNEGKIELTVHNKKVSVVYKNLQSNNRLIKLNGAEWSTEYDELMNTQIADIPYSDLKDENIIEIID